MGFRLPGDPLHPGTIRVFNPQPEPPREALNGVDAAQDFGVALLLSHGDWQF